MTKPSQWDKMRNVLNGHRNGKMLTDEAIVEISYILGVEVATNNPFELIETAKTDIGPTEGVQNESDELVRNYHASTVRREWGTYCRMIAKWHSSPTAESFANYMMILHETDIRA